mgnify:CR=1 FL=1
MGSNGIHAYSYMFMQEEKRTPARRGARCKVDVYRQRAAARTPADAATARLQRSGLFNPGGCPTKIGLRGVLVVERKVTRLGRGVLVVQRKVTRRGALAVDVNLKSRAAACWRWMSDQTRAPRRAGG